MIGSAVGGYVDPDVIKGPKLTDPQQQTSAEGVPRAVVYGTAAVMGNVIQVQSTPTQHKKSQRTGKGGPVQVTYTYTRTAAIRICEAAPLGGEMMLRRVWMNGKLALDRTGTGTIDAESAKLLGQLTFYSGSETQLPDPDLEALPAGDGGGVGNVPAYRGTCYAVLRNVDVTNGGALPQIMWEVSSSATETADVTPWMLARIGSSNDCVKFSPDGIDWSEAFQSAPLSGGGFWIPDANGTMLYHDGGVLAQATSAPSIGGVQKGGFYDGSVWHPANVGSTDAQDSLLSIYTGTNWLVPRRDSDATESVDGQTFSSIGLDLEALALIDSGVLGIKVNGSNPNVLNCYLRNLDGSAISDLADLDSLGYTPGLPMLVSDESAALLSVHRATVGPDYNIELFWTTDGSAWNVIPPPFPDTTGIPSRVMHYGYGRYWTTSNNRIAHGETAASIAIDAFTFPESINGIGDDGNKVVVCGNSGMLYSWNEDDGWVELDSGTSSDIMDVVALGGCNPPTGAIEIPDSPGHYVTIDGDIVGCGGYSVDPSAVYLSDIVADWCDRSEVYDYEVTELSAITVLGIALTQPTDAAGCIQAAQQVYPFDFPEWGNSGETGTKLRAVLRGGSSVATITDDDLLEGDEDETVRRQQVEFPRKVTLFAPDPDANYEATPQTAERESENVKATGAVSISTAFILTRDEKASLVDRLHKILWEEANGTAKFELPEEYTRLTCSDPVVYDGRRYRIHRTEMGDGVLTVEGTRDRVSSYSSNATGNSTSPLPTPISNLRGPTMFSAMNLPSLKTSDNVPGMYIAVCGLLPGWSGCDLYLSVDGGATEQLVTTIIDPAIMGVLTSSIGAADEPLSIRLYNDDELDSASAAQIAARLNGAAVTTVGVSEVLQFETPTDTGTKTWDLTGLHRALLGTTAAEHVPNDSFVLLEQSVIFLPLDISLAGHTLIFRPVSRGTIPENNATYEVVFSPIFTSVVVDAYADENGEHYADEDGNIYYSETST